MTWNTPTRVGACELHLPKTPCHCRLGITLSQAKIAGSDGQVLAVGDDRKGIVVADVTIDPERKPAGKPKAYGRTTTRGPLAALSWVRGGPGPPPLPAERERKAKARAVSDVV